MVEFINQCKTYSTVKLWNDPPLIAIVMIPFFFCSEFCAL